MTYRSGPEWEKRFSMEKIDHPDAVLPRYHAPEFLIEDYIRHQVNLFKIVECSRLGTLFLAK